MTTATQPAHTPGPWVVLPAEDGVSYLRVRGNRLGARYKVANVMAPNDLPWDEAENKANVCLVASAPDLLEALRGLLQANPMKSDIWPLRKRLAQMAAWAAIDKATGSAA